MNCKNPRCGKLLPPGLRRNRAYCNNACKQAHYRQVHQASGPGESSALEEARQRIAELEEENTRLLNKLDLERRFHADHERRSFKAWLKKQHAISEVGQRIRSDDFIPAMGSRSLYEAYLRKQKYSSDELAEFEHLWKLMLLS